MHPRGSGRPHLAQPPVAKHAMGTLSRASAPAPEMPRSWASARSHLRPPPQGWGCCWEPAWLHHTLRDARHSPRRSGLASGSGDVAPGAVNVAAHCRVLVPGQDKQGGGAIGSPRLPAPSVPAAWWDPHDGWWVPPRSRLAGTPSLFLTRVTPDTQELIPRRPLPTMELCLISLR